MQTLLNLFPDVEFETSNNEEEDVNECLVNPTSQAIKNMKYNCVGLCWFVSFLIQSKTIAFPKSIFFLCPLLFENNFSC